MTRRVLILVVFLLAVLALLTVASGSAWRDFGKGVAVVFIVTVVFWVVSKEQTNG